jgi:hypothetical protein
LFGSCGLIGSSGWKGRCEAGRWRRAVDEIPDPRRLVRLPRAFDIFAKLSLKAGNGGFVQLK